MLNITDINGHVEKAKQHRQIKLTSKRQFTIPKSFFDSLNLSDGLIMDAFLFDGAILLKPEKRTETIQDEDYSIIIKKIIAEGYRGKELADEITFRVSEYDNFIAKRIEEFEKDINADDACEDDIGVEDLNGLEVFINTQNGADNTEVEETNS